MSKAAGGNWPAFKQPQSQCWSGKWGSNDGLYFGGISCNIVGATAELFASDAVLTVGSMMNSANVEPDHFGTALQSPDLTAVWGFRTLLDRDFTSTAEYTAAVASLPALVLGARGARAAFVQTIVASTEFQASACARNTTCVAARVGYFLCLNRASCMAAIRAVEAEAEVAAAVRGGALSGVGVGVGVGAGAGAGASADALIASAALAADSASYFGNAALMDASWCIGC